MNMESSTIKQKDLILFIKSMKIIEMLMWSFVKILYLKSTIPRKLHKPMLIFFNDYVFALIMEEYI